MLLRVQYGRPHITNSSHEEDAACQGWLQLFSINREGHSINSTTGLESSAQNIPVRVDYSPCVEYSRQSSTESHAPRNRPGTTSVRQFSSPCHCHKNVAPDTGMQPNRPSQIHSQAFGTLFPGAMGPLVCCGDPFQYLRHIPTWRIAGTTGREAKCRFWDKTSFSRIVPVGRAPASSG